MYPRSLVGIGSYEQCERAVKTRARSTVVNLALFIITQRAREKNSDDLLQEAD